MLIPNLTSKGLKSYTPSPSPWRTLNKIYRAKLCREVQVHMITTNCLSFMWLTCDQAVLLRQLSRSPRKKKKRPIAGYQRDYNLGNTSFFLLFSTLRVFYLT